MVERFINLYKDLFVKASWVEDREDKSWTTKVDTTKGPLYKLVFLMNHDDMRKIEKDLNIRRKTIVRNLEYFGEEKRSIRNTSNGSK